jgi:hypothetical protein
MNSTEPDHDSSHHWPVVVGRRLREIVAQRRRNRGLSRLTLGGYTITMKGVARADLRDSYHLDVNPVGIVAKHMIDDPQSGQNTLCKGISVVPPGRV